MRAALAAGSASSASARETAHAPTETARRLRGTTEFMTEEAVKPIITAAGQVAKVRAMMRTVRGQDRRG